MSGIWQSSVDVVIDANLAVWAVVPVLAKADMPQRFRGWRQEGRRIASPALWLAEAVSVIRWCVYRRLISDDDGSRAVKDLFSLNIEVAPLDMALCQSAFRWAGRLGQAKAYDALYLALAEQMGAELWTADRRLANGAQQIGAAWVHWIGEEPPHAP